MKLQVPLGVSVGMDRSTPASIPGYLVVPSDEYPTIQAAHDALPPEGGGIWLAGSTTETDIVLRKAVKIVGQGTRFDTAGPHSGRPIPASPLEGPGSVIDTSGGNGIDIQTAGVVLRDVQIIGDYSGGYGIRIGTDSRGSNVLDNVFVVRKGGHGFLIEGGQLNNKIDGVAWDCHGDGWRFESTWFNEHLFDRMVGYACQGNGVTIQQSMDPDNERNQRSRFNGNTINQFWMELNEGWGLYIEDDVRFEGNHISGYGIEHNQGDGDQMNQVIKVSNLFRPEWRDGGSGNLLHLRNLIRGTIDLDREEFEMLTVTNVSGEDVRM